MYSKIITAALIPVLITGGFFFPHKARAQSVDKCLSGALSGIMGDILGGFLPSIPGLDQKVPTSDQGAQKGTRAFQFDECIKSITDAALKVALQNLKKKLLDNMVDDTIAWIRDDREPKYITNFKDFTESAVEEAANNTLREIDLANLYPDPALQEGIKAAIMERVRSVRFSDTIACTLTDEVNVDEFKGDFRKGGFAGLQVASMPNNNPEDVAMMARLFAQANEEQQLAEKNALSSGLTQSDVDCTQWVLAKSSGGIGGAAGAYYKDANGNMKIEITEPQQEAPVSNIPNTKYICQDDATGSGQYVSTPPTVVDAIAAKVATQDIDYVLGMDDIQGYISGIADAVFNRILKGGFNLFERGGDPSSYLEGLEGDIENYQSIETGEKLQGQANEQVKRALISKTNLLIDTASTSLSATNAALTKATALLPMMNATSSPEGLAVCMDYHPAFFPAFINPDPTPSWWPTGNRTVIMQKLRAVSGTLTGLTNPFKTFWENGKTSAADYQTQAQAITGSTPPNVISTLQANVNALEASLNAKTGESSAHNSLVNDFYAQGARERNRCVGPANSS
jgi:hypothetical protein